MTEISPFTPTYIQYCREFVRDAWEMPELVQECSQLDPLLQEMVETGEYHPGALQQIEQILNRCEMKIMNLFSRFPDSTFLSTMYSRVSSLKSMSRNIVNPME